MTETEQLEYVSAKVPRVVFQTLTEAARLSGTSLGEFIVQAALEKAEALLDPERTTVLSVADVVHLFDLVDHPRPPNGALIKAFERYKARDRNDDADHSTKPPAKPKVIR